jgi:sulfur carrier protein ThiS
MKIKVNLLRSNSSEQIDVSKDDTIQQVLSRMGLHEDMVIVLHKNQPIPIDERVSCCQELTLVEVSSGG